MPSAWIITQTNPRLVEAFQHAGWEVEAFAPRDLLPASQCRVRDLDVIIFEVAQAEGPFFDKFKELAATNSPRCWLSCRTGPGPTGRRKPAWTR